MIQTRESFFPFAALTDAGLVRQKNEDRFAITAFRSDTTPSIPGLLAVLCDGVGGESAGEIAAELAVGRLAGLVQDSAGSASQPLKPCSRYSAFCPTRLATIGNPIAM